MEILIESYFDTYVAGFDWNKHIRPKNKPNTAYRDIFCNSHTKKETGAQSKAADVCEHIVCLN